MEKDVVLIDYENVQAIDLKLLEGREVLIKVFHGKGQKFDADFLKHAMAIGKPGMEVIEISGSGRNALDFHIAYYIGRLSKEVENPSFYVISKDKGFVPLMEHVRHEQGIPCALHPTISDLPFFKDQAPQKVVKDRLTIVKENLSKAKAARPKRRKTLCNQIKTIFKKEITESEVEGIVQRLEETKVIAIKDDKVEYLI